MLGIEEERAMYRAAYIQQRHAFSLLEPIVKESFPLTIRLASPTTSDYERVASWTILL
jgi:hypothetical protein